MTSVLHIQEYNKRVLFSCRYKMTCEYTWPHHLMASDREAVETIVTQHGFQDDVAYGHTKLFVRTPRSLFTLEQERAALIPILVLFLQKVSRKKKKRKLWLHFDEGVLI